MSAGFKHTAARVITSNRHMAATAIKGLTGLNKISALLLLQTTLWLIIYTHSSDMLHICDWICENMHSSHIQFFNFED